MAYPTKIATCCYCASRTVLTLDQARHELTCTSCGAPLRQLKQMPRESARARPAISHQPAPVQRKEKPVRTRAPYDSAPKKQARKVAKRKPRKSWLRHLAEEAFDIVEDIFD